MIDLNYILGLISRRELFSPTSELAPPITEAELNRVGGNLDLSGGTVTPPEAQQKIKFSK